MWVRMVGVKPRSDGTTYDYTAIRAIGTSLPHLCETTWDERTSRIFYLVQSYVRRAARTRWMIMMQWAHWKEMLGSVGYGTFTLGGH